MNFSIFWSVIYDSQRYSLRWDIRSFLSEIFCLKRSLSISAEGRRKMENVREKNNDIFLKVPEIEVWRLHVLKFLFVYLLPEYMTNMLPCNFIPGYVGKIFTIVSPYSPHSRTQLVLVFLIFRFIYAFRYSKKEWYCTHLCPFSKSKFSLY